MSFGYKLELLLLHLTLFCWRNKVTSDQCCESLLPSCQFHMDQLSFWHTFIGQCAVLSPAPLSGLRLAQWELQRWSRVLAQLGSVSGNLHCFMKALRVRGCLLSATCPIQDPHSLQSEIQTDTGG